MFIRRQHLYDEIEEYITLYEEMRKEFPVVVSQMDAHIENIIHDPDNGNISLC
jgi:hypothetical protein